MYDTQQCMNKLFGYVQTYEEAVVVVHATRLGYVRPVQERLTVEERENLKSGDIFVFIESQTGIKRWTDGRIWSPSKIHGQFLLYKEVPKHLSKSAIKKTSRNRNMSKQEIDKLQKEIKEEDRMSLHKKTISIIHNNKVYHVITYFRPMFAKETLMNIPFYKQIHNVIRRNTHLLCDEYVDKERMDTNYYIKYYLPLKPNTSILSCEKRDQLEKVALNVLQEWASSKTSDNTVHYK